MNYQHRRMSKLRSVAPALSAVICNANTLVDGLKNFGHWMKIRRDYHSLGDRSFPVFLKVLLPPAFFAAHVEAVGVV